MGKYIKLEDAIYADCILIDEIECDDCPFYDEEYVLCRMVKWLESLPTIDIVRCKDCKHINKSQCVTNLDGTEKRYKCDCNGDYMLERNFCSYGERIEE